MAIAKELRIAAVEVSNKRAAGKSSGQPSSPPTAADYNEFLAQLEISGSYLNFYKSAVWKFQDVAPAKILAAIHWLIKGHGLDITPSDIRIAFFETMEAAKLVGQEDEALQIINKELENKNKNSNVYQVLKQALQMR